MTQRDRRQLGIGLLIGAALELALAAFWAVNDLESLSYTFIWATVVLIVVAVWLMRPLRRDGSAGGSQP